MKRFSRYLRLLPAVVIVGGGLLAIKGVDLARAAQAPAETSGDPDNSGLAPADAGARPPTDFANDDGTVASAAEVDVLSSLTRRRAELDARERALNMRENLLAASEGRVDQKIGALKGLQGQMQTLLAQRDAAQDAQIKALIKSYGPDGMKAAKAAAIFNTMPDEVLLPIAKGLKPGDLGAILAQMNPQAAQKLTVKLAALLKLPDTTPAALCPTATADAIAAPVTTADGSPVVTPLQTASLTPPAATPLPLPPAPAVTPPPQNPTPAAATTPPAQAAAAPPPKPHKPAVHHTPPAKPAVASAPAKPATAIATPPAKPATATLTPPAKPVLAATTTPPAAPVAAPVLAPPAHQTAAIQPLPAIATPAKPVAPAASGPPTAIAPAKPAGG